MFVASFYDINYCEFEFLFFFFIIVIISNDGNIYKKKKINKNLLV